MNLGKVVGHVWATKKDESLSGYKLMVVEFFKREELSDETVVAIDTVGAGIGDTVLVSRGSSARFLLGQNLSSPIDAAIVGIVDEIQR